MGGNIPWITGADFTSKGIGEVRRYVSAAAVRNTSTNVVEKGNLLIVTRTGVGKLAIAPFDVAVSQDITGVYPNSERVDPWFLYHRMQQGLDDLKKLNQGTSINGILRSDLLNYAIDLPPLGIQRRIAEILSTVDEAIEQTEALIAKTQQIKTGLMHDLFTRGVTPDGRLRPTRGQAPDLYKQSQLGWIPREWTVRRLQEIATVDRGRFSVRPRDDPRYYGGDFPFAQTGDVALASGGVLTAYTQTLNEKGRSVSRIFDVGTIMVTIAANIGDTCILGIPMCAPDSIVGVKPSRDETPRFIELSIRRRKSWLENRAPQTAQKNINLEDLRPLQVPCPGLREQREISERYESLDDGIGNLKNRLSKLCLIKQALMQELLASCSAK